MPGIICAIRGGPASQLTIEKALEVAIENKLPLFFLFVINLHFLTHTSISRTNVLVEELHEMGEFILSTAQAQAESQGVPTEGFIRNGQVVDEIIQLCQEVEADYVILGQPKGQKDENLFTQERLSVVGQHIEEESRAKVILAEGTDR